MSYSINKFSFLTNLVNPFQDRWANTEFDILLDKEHKKQVLEVSNQMIKDRLISDGYDPVMLHQSITSVFQNVIQPFLERDQSSPMSLCHCETECADLTVLVGDNHRIQRRVSCLSCDKTFTGPTSFEISNNGGKLTLDTWKMHSLIDHNLWVLGKDVNPILLAKIVSATVLN